MEPRIQYAKTRDVETKGLEVTYHVYSVTW